MVVLSQVLAHPSNVGYEHLANQLVTSVNGVAVTSLVQMLRLVESNADPYLQLELEPHNERVVLDAATLATVTAELLHTHQIPADRSADLRQAAAAGSSSRANGHAAGGAEEPRAQRKRAR